MKTLLPLPTREQSSGGWTVNVDFLKAIREATKISLIDFENTPSLEQIEAVLLAANATFIQAYNDDGK